MKKTNELGVTQVAERIHGRLQRYLEAQYHIRDTALIEERRILLQEPGGISQRPFIEITPSYATAGKFSELKIPDVIRNLLQTLSEWSPGVGVFPPYRHQADALEHFFAEGNDGNDLIVATGTGSGKTETFLYAVLGALALEGTERPESFKKDGIRALLLYPMNALVSDQTARLRRLFGNERLAEHLSESWGRHPRFGMYTSRTPYPGVRKGAKDERHIAPVLAHYERLETSLSKEDQKLVSELRSRGRWPAKNILAFFGKDLEQEKIFKKGKKKGKTFIQHKWSDRFFTHEEDRELYTRHEMQEHAPDLLVTNYSMLEYMLLRPIERSIFSQTRSWLEADPRNQLLLILDEAHMYRGVGGAEVGLLIRRLMSRLGVNRDRFRCILTSASLGTGDAAELAGQTFANGLTGPRSDRSFAVVRGTREKRNGEQAGTMVEAEVLGKVDAAILAAAEIDLPTAHNVVSLVAKELKWPNPPTPVQPSLKLRQYVTRQFTGFGPLELLIEQCSGNAIPFEELSRLLFPDNSQSDAERATNGLLAMGCFARRIEPGRDEQPLLPTRVHMLFRGLPSLHACVNSICPSRRYAPGEERLVGRLYTEPRTKCECGSRVYELYTHRDCGAAFFRVFGTGPDANFFWHEQGGTLTEFGKPLHELHLLLEEPHVKMIDARAVKPILIDMVTGRIVPSHAASESQSRLCYLPSEPTGTEENLSTFSKCPVCTRKTRTGKTQKIMDLATKGEQPFANLVREQFVSQAATREPDDMHPNEGRKALLFSDGRQKAARLARDLPREVERDSFREALVLAITELKKYKPEAVLDESLYAAFISICARYHLHFFDGSDQQRLLEECNSFVKDYEGDLDSALANEWRPSPLLRYRQALLRQISDPYYSLIAACAAVVEPRPIKLTLFERRVKGLASTEVLKEISTAWSREMLARSAFDPAISKDARQDEFAYFDPVSAEDDLKQFFAGIKDRSGLDSSDIAIIRSELFETFTREGTGGADSGRLLLPDYFRIDLALNDIWQQCGACGHLQLQPFFGSCANCGERRLERRPPEHPYMVARKDFFREPMRAVLAGARPVHITAEEHTAQLSQRDAGVVYATTEEFELRFQDVPLGSRKPPVDVLSCTTTMEVGIDIGSLTAVGLRTVPPQRENYQQRAGRAGRRGTSVSSVITFAQGGAHDAHYFANPQTMISGPPREPRIKSDNRRLARRHIHSHLLQTFFHNQLDKMTAEAQEQLAKTRPNIMSTFGTAKDFYNGSGDFTYGEFEQWVRQQVLVPRSNVVEEIARWLPDELALENDKHSSKKAFVKEVAEQLLHSLSKVPSGMQVLAATSNEPEENDEIEEDIGSLIDMLFDKGLLPSYAFPTDLCSFVIQEWGDKYKVRVKERPQLSKVQALSEYAPGRLLVVNKQTYRVGGVYIDGPPTTSPAGALFSQDLTRYVGCPQCTFIRLEPGNTANPIKEGSLCPICDAELYVRELIDPPAFSPEKARAVPQGDREQEMTYASSAQLPELVDQDEFDWHSGAGIHLQHAYGQDVLLIVANKGKDTEGFSICEVCGAAWPAGEDTLTGNHSRPFLVPKYILNKENAPYKCNGNIRSSLFLGHEFRTDILLLRVSFSQPIDFSPKQPWLHDSLHTLAEALALGASLHLDIDPGELSAGFRLAPVLGKEDGLAELFLFDTASGGAGYAAEAGGQLSAVLDRTEKLLRECSAACESSCTKCLRHYGNRFLHPRLNRHLALDLLRYVRHNNIPEITSSIDQARTLNSLARFLELEGWGTINNSKQGSINVPLLVTAPSGGIIAIGTYPALLSKKHAYNVHSLRSYVTHPVILLPDYVVERDLPAAYQYITQNPTSTVILGGPSHASNSNDEEVEVEVPEVDFLDLLGGKSTVICKQHIRMINSPSGCVVVKPPIEALLRLGMPQDTLLVIREVTEEDYDGQARLLLSKNKGNFKLTGANWTVAQVKRIADDDGDRLQISYGRREAEFRPERFSTLDVKALAVVVEVIQNRGRSGTLHS
jgi:ATP-dependent helicase YprA (DUF1998 family)